MIIDTHAHLSDDAFRQLDSFLEAARSAGVGAVLTVATSAEDSQACLRLAERYPAIRAAVGIHPNYCCQAAEHDWETVVRLSGLPGVAALGETGLDRYWDDCPWETQVDFFRRHLELSRATQLPVVIHTRECAEETLDILREEARAGQLRGVMHSFTGSWEVAAGCLELGLYISFAGMVTFKNADDLREVARRVPSDRILVETDSPYLTPHPLRGQRPNHPALIVHTARRLAEIRELSESDFNQQTTQNAQRLFGPWPSLEWSCPSTA